MDLSSSVLGRGVVAYLRERQKAAVLTIGSDTFDRAVLAGVECYSFLAAANLSRLVKEIGVKNTRDLYENVPPERLVLPRLGAVTLAVLGAAFEAKRVGGSSPLESYFAKHRSNGHVVSFATLKHRDDGRAAAAATRSRKRR